MEPVLEGADLDSHERRYLELLADAPLDLYEIADCEPGNGLWLVSKTAESPERRFVREIEASRQLAAGEILAARVVPLEPPVLSGALYRFPRDAYLRLRSEILSGPRDEDGGIESLWISDRIVESWLALLVGPPPLVTDASTGEPIALTTVDYRIEDWERLVEALSGEPGVEFDAGTETFEWLEDTAEGTRRTRWMVRRIADDRLELDARTASLADEGENRLSAIAGEAVTRLGRKVFDPRELWKERHRGAPHPLEEDPLEGLTAEEKTGLIRQAYRQMYARWADEPVPLLKNRTPREAIGDEAGLKDVVELLRSYEVSERQRAEREGRKPVDLLFLWESLGLDRSKHVVGSGSAGPRRS
jgi:hypothetical protein